VKPSDLAITLAALSFPQHLRGGWLCNDEIRHRLMRLGFEPTAQHVAGRLTAMCHEDVPRFERRDAPWRAKEYRVTQWGRNDVHNKLPGLDRP
jgi:hypothetical protein